MKINFSSEITGIKGAPHLPEEDMGQVRIGARAQNYSKPAGKNPSGFVTFKGGIHSKLSQLGEKAVKSHKFNKAIGYVLKHEAMFNALISLGIVATIRPLITLSMPVAEKKDKVAVASKEIIGGVVGYGLACLVFKPISSGVNKIVKDPSRFIRNDNGLITKLGDKKYLDAFTSFWKNIPDTVVAPIKGVVTVALMPFVISLIDKMRNNKANPPSANEIEISRRLEEQFSQIKNNELFSKVANAEKSENPAFKGNFMKKAGDKATDKIAEALGWLAKTKPAKATAEGVSEHFKNPTQRIQDLTSVAYTFTLMNKTAKSKKIEKERKPMLMINAALVTLISSSLAAILDKVTDPLMEKMSELYKTIDKPAELMSKKGVRESVKWLSDDKFKAGLKKMKSYTIFTSTVRFVVPVLMVPISGAIVNKLKAKNKATA